MRSAVSKLSLIKFSNNTFKCSNIFTLTFEGKKQNQKQAKR